MLKLRSGLSLLFASLVLAAFPPLGVAGCYGSSQAPELQLTVDMAAPVRGSVVLTANPTGFVPVSVDFYLEAAHGTPAHTDVEAPFTWSLDTEGLEDGSHVVLAVASDGSDAVVGQTTLEVRNRPNIVIVYVDDLDGLQSPFLEAMPNTLALLAEQGLRFTRSFAPSPVCTPARAMTLTGRYPHNTGVFDITPPDGGHPPFAATQEDDTVATRLREAGYRNAFLGKYIAFYNADPSHVPPGWDEWFAVYGNKYEGFNYDASHNGTVVSYGDAPEDYQTDVLSDLALEFIDSTEADDDQPFMIFLAPAAPHIPMPPAPRHQNHPWASGEIAPWPSFDEPDVSDKPMWIQDGMEPLGFGNAIVNILDYRDRMGSLMAVDDMIGALMQRLADTDELAQTVFFFASDNGYNLGAHRLLGKGVPYEEAVRVPLFVAGRDVRVGTEARMVNHTDIVPTFLDLAGAPHDDLDGYSMVPLFEGVAMPWREDQIFEFNGTFGGPRGSQDTYQDVLDTITSGVARIPVPSYRALRTQNQLYVQWYRGDVHEYELYDLMMDPFQLDNLLGTPEGAVQHADAVAVLQARLEALMVCSGPSCR